MKFTAAFALAVVAGTSAVFAAPTPGYDAVLEARSELIEQALDEVCARYYEESLEELEAREYEVREYYEDIFERSPMMKKFATDLATGLAQKAPGYADQWKKSEERKARNAQPRLTAVVKQAQAAQQKPATPPPAIKTIPPASKWNTVKKPSVMAEIKKLGKKQF